MTARIFLLLFLTILAGNSNSFDFSVLSEGSSAQITVKSCLQVHPGTEVSSQLRQLTAPERHLLFDVTEGFALLQHRTFSAWLSRENILPPYVREFELPRSRAPPV